MIIKWNANGKYVDGGIPVRVDGKQYIAEKIVCETNSYFDNETYLPEQISILLTNKTMLLDRVPGKYFVTYENGKRINIFDTQRNL